MKSIFSVAACAALVAATLCVSTTAARMAWGTAAQDSRVFIRLSEEPRPQGFEAQVRDGEVVGMTAVKKGGGRTALKQLSAQTCAATCPEDRKLTCWGDDAQVTSVCICGTGQDEPAPTTPRRRIRATREVILAGGA